MAKLPPRRPVERRRSLRAGSEFERTLNASGREADLRRKRQIKREEQGFAGRKKQDAQKEAWFWMKKEDQD